MTLAQLLCAMTERLACAGVQDASFDAKQLLLFAFGIDETSFLLRRNEEALQKPRIACENLIARRVNGEPLQYLLGAWNFLDESYTVGPGVLIPRPETEDLVLLCEERLQNVAHPVILDLCAGSGCIGLSLQKRFRDAEVWLVEYSDQALSYLRKNVKAGGVADRVQVVQGDVLQGRAAFPALPKADLIVSNPPYIPSDEISTLQREVRREPRLALDGGADGLLFYRCFADQWTDALKSDGFFAFECGEGQGAAISDMFHSAGFSTEILNDFIGFDRFVFVSRSRKDAL